MIIKCAIIKWTDSSFYRIEDDFEEEIPTLSKPRTIVSVGVLINEDKHSIAICQDSDSLNDGNRLVLVIPKISISYYKIFTKKIP